MIQAIRNEPEADSAAPSERAGFLSAQRLAYTCTEAVAGELAFGMTEKDAARRMRLFLEARGVRDWLHLPFAWFGDRTAFRGFRLPTGFFPTSRRLEPGMPFILDVAPVLGGFAADVGYADCRGPNAIYDELMGDLAGYRALILDRVRQGDTMRAIYEEIDQRIVKQGYENRHRRYPGRVLGHRVAHLTGQRATGRTLAGFGARSLLDLGRHLVRPGEPPPFWSDDDASDRPPEPGFWAIEPHIAFRGVGVKFEEILVVEREGAEWLDEAVPHVQRWQSS
jgi:Xaa-Pro aminopeptidase